MSPELARFIDLRIDLQYMPRYVFTFSVDQDGRNMRSLPLLLPPDVLHAVDETPAWLTVGVVLGIPSSMETLRILEVSRLMCLVEGLEGGAWGVDTAKLARHWRPSAEVAASLERHRRYVNAPSEILGKGDGRPSDPIRVGRRVGPDGWPLYCEQLVVLPNGVTSLCGLPHGHVGHSDAPCNADWDTEGAR